MRAFPMTPSEARRLKACELSLQRLTSDLSSTGFISSGSVVRRFMPCGKLGCRCQADPPQLHGPYWQWSRVVGGKTVTRRLTEGQASLYREWIASRRHLTKTLAEMDKVSEQAIAILLKAASEPGPDAGDGHDHSSPSPPASTPVRVTRRLAEALVQIFEQIEPVAEAAQQWLDAKDDGDHDLVSEAREDLAAALAESEDLLNAIERLARLARSLPAAPRTPHRLVPGSIPQKA
jgi:hypothetical protein